MGDSNNKTLQAYEDNVQKYVDLTPQDIGGNVEQWLTDHVLKYVPKSSSILELGSGFGRDAKYLEDKGYKVICTDAAMSFVDLMQKQGQKAKILNAITDDFGGPFTMVYANAVLLHFTLVEIKAVLKKAYESLGTKGVLAFTVKEGQGESWSDHKLDAPRFFRYWKEDDLKEVVEGAGFNVIEITKRGSKNSNWLQVIALK